MNVKIDPNQDIISDGKIKIEIEATILEMWEPLNFRYGCSGQLYYEFDGYLYVIRDPINKPKESVKLRQL